MAEPQAPMQIEPESLDDYLEVMSQAIFQTGMSWKMVEGKWHEIREAFEGFSIKRVASFTDDDLDRLAADRRVIRNRRKLAAIIHNAKQILEKDKEYPSFREYLRLNDDFDKTLAALRKDFKFLGPTACYFFLYVVSEKVLPYKEFHERYQKK